jgi:hypothetical protein
MDITKTISEIEQLVYDNVDGKYETSVLISRQGKGYAIVEIVAWNHDKEVFQSLRHPRVNLKQVAESVETALERIHSDLLTLEKSANHSEWDEWVTAHQHTD